MLYIKYINIKDILCSSTGQLQLKSQMRPCNFETLDYASITKLVLKTYKALKSISGESHCLFKCQLCHQYPCSLSVPSFPHWQNGG